MDQYAGHSWANGPAQFAEGNNQEASSEDINFSYGVALWGAVTGNRKLEELGLYLFATQASAIEEYWFDVHERVFPKGFQHPTVAMVWGAGAKYDTWFDEDPGIIHAINFLPFTGGSYYLGRDPAYVRKNFQEVLNKSAGEITTWRDYLLMFDALGDPEDALRRYRDDSLFEPEFGASKAMTYAFITSLHHFGRPDFSTRMSTPYGLTFKKGDAKNVVHFDPKSPSSKLTVSQEAP
jgi:endoglucanase Acf2